MCGNVDGEEGAGEREATPVPLRVVDLFERRIPWYWTGKEVTVRSALIYAISYTGWYTYYDVD